MKKINHLINCALPMALAACGGGGGDGEVRTIERTIDYVSTSRATWSSAGNSHSAEGNGSAGNWHGAEGGGNAGHAFTGQAPMTESGSNQVFMPPSQADQPERTGGTKPSAFVPGDKAADRSAGNWHSAEGGGNTGHAFTEQDPMTGSGSNQAFLPPSQADQPERTGGTKPSESVPSDKVPDKEATAETIYPVKTAILGLFEQGFKRTFGTLSGTFQANLPYRTAHGCVEFEMEPAEMQTTKGQEGYSSHQFLFLREYRAPHPSGINVISSDRVVDWRSHDYYDGHFNFREMHEQQLRCLPKHSHTFPENAKAGDRGVIADLECRGSDDLDGKGPIIGKRRIDYTTSANPKGGLNFVMTRQIQDNHEAGTLTLGYDYHITAEGKATLIGIAVARSGSGDSDFDVRAR